MEFIWTGDFEEFTNARKFKWGVDRNLSKGLLLDIVAQLQRSLALITFVIVIFIIIVVIVVIWYGLFGKIEICRVKRIFLFAICSYKQTSIAALKLRLHSRVLMDYYSCWTEGHVAGK